MVRDTDKDFDWYKSYICCTYLLMLFLAVEDEPAEGSTVNPESNVEGTSEELDAEDPGLQQLARRIT